jgi:hypothetical protein
MSPGGKRNTRSISLGPRTGSTSPGGQRAIVSELGPSDPNRIDLPAASLWRRLSDPTAVASFGRPCRSVFDHCNHCDLFGPVDLRSHVRLILFFVRRMHSHNSFSFTPKDSPLPAFQRCISCAMRHAWPRICLVASGLINNRWRGCQRDGQSSRKWLCQANGARGKDQAIQRSLVHNCSIRTVKIQPASEDSLLGIAHQQLRKPTARQIGSKQLRFTAEVAQHAFGRQIAAADCAFHRGGPAGVGPIAGQE